MKKNILTICILLSSFLIKAQDISYGVILGSSAYDNEIKGYLEAGAGYDVLHFGMYADYQINEKTGLKVNLTFGKNKDTRYYLSEPGSYIILDDIRYRKIEFQPHVKYDFKNQYNQGFYMLAGPRVSFVFNVENESGDKIEDFYKSTRFGGQLGFGTNISKYFNIEFIGDYGFSNFLKDKTYKGTTLGGHLNLIMNLESLINKNKILLNEKQLLFNRFSAVLLLQYFIGTNPIRNECDSSCTI